MQITEKRTEFFSYPLYSVLSDDFSLPIFLPRCLPRSLRLPSPFVFIITLKSLMFAMVNTLRRTLLLSLTITLSVSLSLFIPIYCSCHSRSLPLHIIESIQLENPPKRMYLLYIIQLNNSFDRLCLQWCTLHTPFVHTNFMRSNTTPPMCSAVRSSFRYYIFSFTYTTYFRKHMKIYPVILPARYKLQSKWTQNGPVIKLLLMCHRLKKIDYPKSNKGQFE